MERKEFKQRLKGLLAWTLVMILMVNNVQGSFMSVYAEGTEEETGTESTESMLNIPVNYYDGIWDAEDLMSTIKPEDGGAWITNTDYTQVVNAAGDATVITDVVLPTVEKDGCLFVNWELGISGEYDEATHEVTLGDGWTAELLDELSFIANFQEALTSDICYTFPGGTMNGEADEYSYTVTQTDIDITEFEEPVTTLIPVQEGMVFTGWQMEVSYQTWYDEETGIIHGVYGEPTELYADWRDENTITVEYLISEDFSGIGSIDEADAMITYYETQTPAPVVAETPDVTVIEDGWFFNGWYCPELADMPQKTFELFYPECEISEDGMTIIGGQDQSYTMYADFVPAMEIIVSFDSGNGEEPVQNTIRQSSIEQEAVTITLPEAPVYEDYTFAGWYFENSDTVYPAGAEVTFDIYQEFAGFYAQWEVELPITYDTAGGKITSTNHDMSVATSIDATSAEGVVLPTVEKENAFFLNWELGISSGGIYDPGMQDISWDYDIPASTLTGLPFNAVWQDALVSAITYEYAGGILNGLPDSYVTLVTQPTMDSKTFEEEVIGFEPTKERYIFTGWELQVDETGSGSYDITDTGAVVSGNYGENYTLVAQWRPENTITINATIASGFENAGTIDSGMSGTYGESTNNDGNGNYQLMLPEIKDIAEGYLFTGWKLYDVNNKEVIMDGYMDITDYDNTVISGYPTGTSLLIAYPTDDKNAGDNSASYVLEAQFKKANLITVTYDTNGGSELSSTSETVYQSAIGTSDVFITLPSAPTKGGFEFAGWSKSTDNNPYKPGDTVSLNLTDGDVTFTAQWNEVACELEVSYNLDGGTITSEEYATVVELMAMDTEAEVTLPAVEKEGYFFTGWTLKNQADMVYEAGEQSLIWDASAPAYTLDKLELTANWVAVKETIVSYNLNGGNIDGSTEVLMQEYTQPSIKEEMFSGSIIEEVPVRKGYIFTGWSLGATEGSSYEDGVLNGYYGTDYTLTAQWRSEHVLNFTFGMSEKDSDFGEVVGITNLTFNESVTAGPVKITLPEVNNLVETHLFTGWKCYDETGAEYKPAETGYDTVNGYASGTEFEFDYVLMPDSEEGNTVTYTWEAQFVEAETIEVTYDLNGGTGLENLEDTVYQSSLDEKTGIIVLPELLPTREGYEFAGWVYSVDNKVYEAGSSIACAYTQKSVTFTAQWEEKGYVIPVEYTLDGGSITSEEYTTEVNLWTNATEAEVMLPEVEKAGYFFTGWILTNNEEMVYESGAQYLTWSENAPAYTLDRLELTANWVAVKETIVSYNLNGGNIDGSTEVLMQEYTQPSIKEEMFSGSIIEEVPVRKGYIFTGWSLGATEGSSYEDGVLNGYYGTDYTLTAQWRSEHVLNFTFGMSEANSDFGEVIGTTNLTFNESVTAGPVKITLPEVNALVETHLFTGWKCYDETGAEYTPTDAGYDAVNGYASGTEFEFDYVPMPDSEEGNTVTYTWEAQFVAVKSIQITYDLNGGTGIENLTDIVYQGALDETTANITLPKTVPTRNGYDFAGWLCNMDNGVYKAGITVECAFTQRTVKFTAQWKEQEYNISLTYDTDGGKITTTDYTQMVQLLAMANTAEAVELPSVEKEGYFFKYWKLTNNETVEYLAGTQYLTWSENEPAYLLKGLTLKAYWQEALKSVITFNLDGGAWSDDQEVLTQTFTQPDSNMIAFSESIIEETPKKNGFVFAGWTMVATDTSGYDEETGLISGQYGTDYVLTAMWESMIEAGTVTLQAGEKYRLAEGNWMVNGDPTVYVGGGYFYVSEDGDYTFTEK